jgi:acyl-CoA reductase-like NAD-dependent aldehyde dehydrogenase
MRLDGKYYCRIYQHGILGAIASTEDFDSEEEALEAAEEINRGLQLKTDEA